MHVAITVGDVGETLCGLPPQSQRAHTQVRPYDKY